LLAAKRKYPATQDFGDWLQISSYREIEKDERAALIKIGEQGPFAEKFVRTTSLTSPERIWQAIQELLATSDRPNSTAIPNPSPETPPVAAETPKSEESPALKQPSETPKPKLLLRPARAAEQHGERLVEVSAGILALGRQLGSRRRSAEHDLEYPIRSLFDRLRPEAQAESNTSVNVRSAAWLTGLLRMPDRNRSQLMEIPKPDGSSRREPGITAGIETS
jgi:pyruvate/2-oxoglutarate dehydrogenase complex dihydrolipoamide acyltransferase (E2) component